MIRCTAFWKGRSPCRAWNAGVYLGRQVCGRDANSTAFIHYWKSLDLPVQPLQQKAAKRARSVNAQHSPLLRMSFASASPSSKVRVVKSDSDFLTTLKNAQADGRLAVVDFTATWCGPCRKIAPFFEKLSSSLPDVTFLKVDIDEEGLQETVAAAEVRAVPTFHFYKEGLKVAEMTGADSESLKEKIDELLKSN